MLNVFALGNLVFSMLFFSSVSCLAMEKKLQGSQAKINDIYKSINNQDYDQAIVLANQCFEMVKDEAMLMQENIRSGLKPKDPFESWALNDAGECIFLLGEANRLLGKQDEADKYYQQAINDFPDSYGGTSSKDIWLIKKAAEGRLQKDK